MICKLIDELHWDELKGRLELFRNRMQPHLERGFGYVIDTSPFPYSFVFDHMIWETQKSDPGMEYSSRVIAIFNERKLEQIHENLQANLKELKKRLIFTICFSSIEEEGRIVLRNYASDDEKEVFYQIIKESNLENIYRVLEQHNA